MIKNFKEMTRRDLFGLIFGAAAAKSLPVEKLAKPPVANFGMMIPQTIHYPQSRGLIGDLEWQMLDNIKIVKQKYGFNEYNLIIEELK